MLSLLALASIAVTPVEERPRTAAVEPARAVVRIIRGAEIRFGEEMRFEESIRREAAVRDQDGTIRTASLIEFY
jgi:hypothetical protein